MAARENLKARRRPWLRGVTVWMPIAVFAIGMLQRNPSAVRAMQDESAATPHPVREDGPTGTKTYAGEAKCLSCHRKMTSQASTAMGMAAQKGGGSGSLDYSSMNFRDGPYAVTIVKGAEGLQMRASDDKESMAIPIRWIFGQGHSGQTFLLEHDGQLYESRASYYKAIANLDLTIGHARKPPASLLEALGRPLPAEEVKKCFLCHTSEDIYDGKLDLNQAHPGVNCENCHGAGSEHVSTMDGTPVRSARKDTTIFNPGVLAPADLNEFCGSCHRTTRAVLELGIRDLRTIRFQPYRLESSRCYDPKDERITCIACHDPHQKLETSLIRYDSKCLACHSRQGDKVDQHKAAACPKAGSDCVKCHMPKLDLPGAHFAFTDHSIRVVQPKLPYPD